jgi:hypothetical protein
MNQNYRNYTDQDIIVNVKKVKSMRGLLKSLGLKSAGGNYANMKRNLQRLDVDCSHWTGQAWNRGEQLKDWSNYTKVSSLKPHLVKERGKKCEMCLLESWLDNDIPLECHHIDGDRTNNELHNLQLLCPNCHAQTSNYRNRKR